MKKTKIEWCDSSWNPVTGCFHDCPYCYAGKIAKRFSYEGQTLDAPIDIQETWVKDKRGLDPGLYVLQHEVRLKENGRVVPYPFRFCPTFHRYKLDEPIQQKQPHKIFVCSMADLFGEWVPDEWIEEVFTACEKAPWHKYLFLTKNPKRYCELANKRKLPRYKNFWYGTTITDKDSTRFPGSPVYNTFLSIEPLLEDIEPGLGSFGGDQWIIIGAETGIKKDKTTPRPEWIEKICRAASITQAAVFMKDSLVPIISEENMRREFPEGLL